MRPWLPARLDDARDVSLEREVTEADPAQLELPVVGPCAAADAAAVAVPDLELRLAIQLCERLRAGHLDLLRLERHAELNEQRLRRLVGPRTRHDADVQAFRL